MNRIASAAPSTGKVNRISVEVASMFQVKIGMRSIVMPGARMVKIVAIRLTEPRIVATPEKRMPMTQRSAPRLGEKVFVESGG